MTPKEIAILAAKALDSKKGEDIKVMEVTALTTLADYFVICTGASSTQINALCDAVEERLEKEAEEKPLHRRATGAAPGCCWTTAAWWSTYLTTRPGPSTPWSGCGTTASPWTWARS